MSSAILYIAIVAIWACVLIPRWLRRDPPAEQVAQDEVTAEDTVERQSPPRHRDDGGDPPGERRAAAAPRPGSRPRRDAEHARVLSARRRLLGMLLVLTAGSGALAYTRLAAWWVVVPPSVMLLGYLAVLKAAAKADAERRDLRRAAAARAAQAARAAARRSRAGTRSGARGVTVPDAAVIRLSAPRGPRDPAEATQRSNQRDTELYDQYADAKLRAVGD